MINHGKKPHSPCLVSSPDVWAGGSTAQSTAPAVCSYRNTSATRHFVAKRVDSHVLLRRAVECTHENLNVGGKGENEYVNLK